MGDGSLSIAAFDIQSNQSLMMRLSKDQAKRILSHYSHDFKAIAESVYLGDDRRSLKLK